MRAQRPTTDRYTITPVDPADLDPAAAAELIRASRHVLWFMGDHVNGAAPDNFHHTVLASFLAADATNQRHLCEVFPFLGEPFMLAVHTVTGCDVLRDRVRP